MNWLEIIGTLVGLLYLWLEYRANIYVWVTGIVMPAIYIVVYYEAGLYADCAINIYYVLAAVYGVVMWRTRSNTGQLPVTHTPRRLWPRLVAAFAVLWSLISLLLIHFTDSNVPITDAFTTALSIVAMYMLAHKHAEQWVAWVAVDAVCCALYIYKDLYATSALYGLYTVIAFLGYREWCRMIEKDV